MGRFAWKHDDFFKSHVGQIRTTGGRRSSWFSKSPFPGRRRRRFFGSPITSRTKPRRRATTARFGLHVTVFTVSRYRVRHVSPISRYRKHVLSSVYAVFFFFLIIIIIKRWHAGTRVLKRKPSSIETNVGIKTPNSRFVGQNTGFEWGNNQPIWFFVWHSISNYMCVARYTE